jgi:hypothetical protein
MFPRGTRCPSDPTCLPRGVTHAGHPLPIRALLRTPAVTFTALLIMALGIGATTAIFSVANAVLFRPLPFADPERLVQFGTIGILEFQAYRELSGRSSR